MKKTITLAALILIIPLATSVNLQTNAETPDRVLYPNETVNVNLSVDNLDTRAAENTSILLEVGEREFEYDAGDIEPGEEYNRTLELPEYPAGSYQAKATLNYTGFLGERFTETTRSGFKVRFPDFVRIPRQVYIQDLDIPDNVTAGEEKTVNAIINHDGDIEGDFTAAVVSKDSETEKEFELSPGSQRNLTVNPTFYAPGVSFAETRLYANLNGDLFLLDYLSEQVFVEESRVARVNIEDVAANKQESSANIQVDLSNNGSSTAYEVNVSLSSDDLRKVGQNPDISLLNSGEQESITFEVANPKAEAAEFNPSLNVRFRDGRGYHTVTRNLTLNLNATAADVSVQELEIEEDGENPFLSYLISNNGEEPAENVEISLNSQQGIEVDGSSENLGSIDSGDSKEGGISFSVLKSAVDNLKLNLTASYQTEAGTEKTKQVSTTLEGGYSEGAMCSYDYQCGQSSNPMSCGATPSGESSRCCPPGQTYSSSAGSCLEKLTLVAVPINYEDGSLQDFKQVTEEQVQFFVEKSPFQEAENPRSRVEVKYLRPPQVENPGTNSCYRLNNFAQDVVLDSQYRNTYDKIIATTTEEFKDENVAGCSTFGDTEVTRENYPKTMTHEMGHSFGLGHTKGFMDGCGAVRGSREYPNNAADDGSGEIMNYCPGDKYFSDQSDEYRILKQTFERNGWL